MLDGIWAVLLQTFRQRFFSADLCRACIMFKGRHFDQSVILFCIRWHLAYGLSLRT
ncbi:hypothetical protein MESS4_p20054 [Mesorhizobium sp. STM 4661]|nr:hypothetical protein MESS4_p20054 [Mesorhizobium sp. STM 4661]